jgi:peptide/nickel transport system substrate-binding protein
MSRWLSSLALLSLVVAACAPAAPPAAPAATAPPGKPAATTAPAPAPTTAPAKPAATPRRGGTLTIDTGATKITALDPDFYQVTLEKNVTLLVAEPLIYRDTEFKLAPGLATSWKVADDGLTWTFDLRKGVKFHDGTPFDARAVKANYDRWVHPSTKSGTLKNVVAPMMDGFEIVDDYTVRIKTKRAAAAFTALLSGWAVQLVSPTALQTLGNDIAIKQAGTGPFKIQSMVAGESLTLVRNDDYWGGAPNIEKIEFKSIPEPAARSAALLTNQVDFSVDVPPSQLPRLKDAAGMRHIENPVISQWWIDINQAHPPLDKVEVRKALNHAIDMQELKNVVYEGSMRAFNGPVPPEVFKPDASIPGFNYDPERAKQLISQAGVSTPINLKFLFIQSPLTTRFGEVLQAQLKKVGIELELDRRERAAVIQSVEANRDYDLYLTNHSNSSGDPWVFIGAQLLSNASNNWGAHNNPKFDPLINQMGTELDAAKRAQVLNDFFRLFADDPGYAATHNPAVNYVLSQRLEGFVPHPTGELISLRTAWLKD